MLMVYSISFFPSLTPTIVKTGRLRVAERTLTLPLSTLELFCRQQQATIQAMGQTTWALLLAAYTDNSKVLFGTVISAHQSSVKENVVFPSISTIPVTCETSGSPNDVLRHMMNFNAGAHRYRYTPLSDIQQLAGHSGEQLFDTVFVYQKAATSGLGIDWPLLHETASVDYTLSMEFEVGLSGNLELRLTFDERRIPKDHAELLLQQFEYILNCVVRLPGKTPANVLSELPPKQPTISSDSRTLHGLMQQSVMRYPDRVALEFVATGSNGTHTTRTWTYRQLDYRAAQVASLLHKLGAKPRDIVAVCMNKSAEASFAFLGILKAGCAFLAIDPDLPKSRKEFILQDSSARLLLVGDNDAQDTNSINVPCIEINEDMLRRSPEVDNIAIRTKDEDTCYCLYTSGTTGTPKGCELSHENAVQAMMAFQRLFAGRWTKRSRWLQFASYWFDVSVLEQFWSWSVGMTVVGAPRDLVLEDIPGFIQRFNITHIDLTPSLARLVHPNDVPSLCGGVFITGGEALKQEIIDAWGAKSTICNGYGPTEATIGVTMNTFVGIDAKPSNIGRQFDNVGTYVLHPGTDDIVFKGAIGELCVSGKLVGKGYLNRPELTETAFPFLARLGERVYRTGDLVRMLADGSFLFVGRKDSQTKLRGQRLEVAEIDSVLLQATKDVTHAVTLVLKAEVTGKETLISFFTNNSFKRSQNLALDATEEATRFSKCMREACEDKLPAYMVPTHIIPITFLPLTVNNKIDEKRLAGLFKACAVRELQNLQTDSDDERSLNTTEQAIYDELCGTLAVDVSKVSPRSNVFSLGLSSISAIPFATNLKRQGYAKASVATIMSNPTLVQLSKALTETSTSTHDQADVRLQVKLALNAFAQRYRGFAAKNLNIALKDIEAVVPCTPLQQGLLLESMRDQNRPYFNHFYYNIHAVDTARLISSFQKLVDNCQVLRARFLQTDDGFAQVILRRHQLRVSAVSCHQTELYHTLAEKKLLWISKAANDLPSPFEIHVVRTPEQTVMAIFIHHALYDGISFEAMLNNVAKTFKKIEEVDFGPSFTEALAHGPLLPQNGMKFWKEQFHPSLSKLARTEVTAKANDGSFLVDVRIQDTTSFEKSRKQLGVSHQDIVQSCFEVALRKHVPAALTYGMVVSGRSIEYEGADKVLGPTFNTLPQSLRIQAESSFPQHIETRHTMNVELLPFQHTPLREIKKWCGDGGSDSMFEVLFVFQHQLHASTISYTDILQPMQSEPRADYPLACEAELYPDGTMSITLLAQSMYFDEGQLQDLLATFRKALGHVSSDTNMSAAFGIDSTEAFSNERAAQNAKPQVNGIEKFEWTEHADIIRKAMATLAGVGPDGIDEHTTLFSIGLDSIDAVKLSSRLRKAGLPLPVSQILKAQTIPKMLQAIEADGSHRMVDHSKPCLERLETELATKLMPSLRETLELGRLLPATAQQEGLIADMLRTEYKEYFNHDVLHLRPDADVDRIKAAWQTVVDGTPILRTVFVEVADPEVSVTYAQAVLKTFKLEYTHHQISGLSSLDSVFDEIRADVRDRMETVPPFQITFVEIEEERYMVLSLSHAQYDGHSLALLHGDLSRAYEDTFKIRAAYDDQIESALTANSEEAQSFWTGMLSGANPQPIPRLTQVNHLMQVHRAEKEATINANTIREFCRTNGVSIQALAQTCWALTLAHFTRSAEVLFGVVLACRDTAESQEVAFPTMNTVVVRSALHGSRVEMLQYMQNTVTESIPYQRTPLRTIQAAAASDGGKSLFDTLFIYQKRPAPAELVGQPLYDSVVGDSDTQYPVAVEMEDTAEKLYIRAACKGDVLDQVGATQLVARMDQVLRGIINRPHEPTVAFKDGLASFGGLEPVKLHAVENFLDGGTHQVQEPIDTATSDTVTLHDILETLARVSKVPIEQLTPITTVESIGIDSISAIKVAAILRRKNIHISVSELIRARTAARIAEVAKTSKQDQPSGLTPEDADVAIARVVQQCDVPGILANAAIAKEDVESVLPATAGQVYLLSMWWKTGGQVFHPNFSYKLNAETTLKQINAAWDAVVARQAILRTVFCATEHEQTPVLQVIMKNASESAQRAMVTLRSSECEGGWRLDLKIHHALYDAVSLPLLMRDFQCLLTDSTPTEAALRPADYLAPTIIDTACEERKTFWPQYLNQTNPAHLPQPERDGHQKRIEIFQPGMLSDADALEKLARKHSVSMQALLFAAYAKVYANLASTETTTESEGSEDVVLGIYLSNRSHLPELDTLPAPTLNVVPLLVRSPKESGLVDLARSIQADLSKIGSMVNSAVALWEIAKWTGVKVDTFVNFLKLPEHEESGESNGGIEEMSEGIFERRSKVVEPVARAEFEVPRELKGLEMMGDAYQVCLLSFSRQSCHTLTLLQHSVDIEMTVTKDGNLDVGLFCPETMLSLPDAEKALEEFKGLLQRVIGKAKE